MVKTDLGKSLDTWVVVPSFYQVDFFYDGELFLHFMDKNINSDAFINYLEKNMMPFINSKMKNTFNLQQDGAKPHTSRETIRFLEEKNANLLQWPSKSSDPVSYTHLTLPTTPYV